MLYFSAMNKPNSIRPFRRLEFMMGRFKVLGEAIPFHGEADARPSGSQRPIGSPAA
jgi:hypothetical protein